MIKRVATYKKQNNYTSYLVVLLLFISSILPSSALAYIGPGAGLGAIGILIAIIVAVILLIVGFVWYPVKRLMRARKSKIASGQETDVNNKS